MKQKLIYNGSLPGRNQSENAARTCWANASRMKKNYTYEIKMESIVQRIKPVKGFAKVTVQFYEKDMRRDSDNVYGGLKYILDGLVSARVIKDDSRKHIQLFVLPVELDRLRPRIEVEIEDEG